jgi:hypothetical protein
LVFCMDDLLWSVVLHPHYRRKKPCQISELWLTDADQ